MLARMVMLLTLASYSLAQESWCVAVWYPSSEHPAGAESILLHQNIIDIVHPFWYSPLPDGTLLAHQGAEDPARLTAWREAGLYIIPSIFSSSWGVLEDSLRPQHVQAIVDKVVALDYDGIDIDYEGFAAHTREPFSLFIEELSEALHAEGKLLSVTVHAKTGDDPARDGSGAQDWARLARASRLFNIMTYDYTNRNEPPGPIAPISWVLEVLSYADSVTTMPQVHLGLPFYGYSWLRGRPPGRAITHEAAMRLAGSFNLEGERHEDSAELFLDLDVRGLPRQSIFMNDAVSTAARLERALAAYPSFGGVAIWGLGGEDPAAWEALRHTREERCNLAP